MAKKKVATKKPARTRAPKKSTVGLSESEHGQGWERDEVNTHELDESEPTEQWNGEDDEPGDEDDPDED